MIVKTSESDVPCVGLIDFNIFIHKILPDGSIDPETLDCSVDFIEAKASPVAQLTVTGINKKDCIEKIKTILERINDGS